MAMQPERNREQADSKSGIWWWFFLMIAICASLQPMHAEDCASCATATADTAALDGGWSLKKEVNEVHVVFLASHDNKPVDLAPGDIVLRDDNKEPAAVLGFRNEHELPMRVGMVIDASSSVTSRFRFEQAAASMFLREALSRTGDLGFVMGFSNHATVTQDFSDSPELLTKGVGALKADGGTALYDAVRTACRKLQRRPEHDMVARVLVILSDGQNNAGEASLQDAIAAAQQADVTIYAVSTNYPTSYIQQDLGAIEGNKNLHQLAEQTGGRVLMPPTPKGLDKAFAKISDELRSRYAISYRPADFATDGHYRKIKIEARKGGEKIQIRARKGYYARVASSDDSESQPADSNVIASR
ncbi:MAG TPA: VWA domain-containing protein [Terriglobales bacterium]|nr:VWA domain-containing protein [Terriglobales bacterium]